MASINYGANTIKIFHFHNGSGGGVLSVIRNLLLYKQHPSIENHVIYTINRDIIKNFEPPGLAGSASEQVFYYSSKWNFYYTCKRVAKLLPNEKAVIIANDWLELGMVSHFGLCNPVIQILHGDYDYYYNLSLKHNEWIDAFVTVAEVMADKLRNKMPDRINDIYYLPFPVPDTTSKNFLNTSTPLQLIFIGRLTREKGYDLLPLIEKELRNKNIEVKWHIVGGVAKDEKSAWESDTQVQFHGQLPNEKVIGLMQKMDCLVLPSLAEGMPVTVVEAMKVGLTCLVNDIPGGIQELIMNGLTGYKVEKNKVSLYVEVLTQLSNDRTLLKKIGENARAKAIRNFDAIRNTRYYEQQIEKCYRLKKEHRKVKKVYGSRLDRPWIPNFITKTIRSF